MEFNEKLQQLRKQKGITQEEQAQALFVSRAAVSKWESGRGYPGIDSLKAIAKFYCVSIDELLSGEEVLILAKEDHRQKSRADRDLVYGLLDLSVALLFFLPFFGQQAGGGVIAVSLLRLHGVAPYLKAAYVATVAAIVACGAGMILLREGRMERWERQKAGVSLLLSAMGEILFIVSRQPNPAVFLFVILGIKVFLLLKKP